MPKACCSSYHFAFKLKVIAEAEAVENNSEIARDYGILMVHHWQKDQANLFNGERKMSAKWKTMVCYSPKYPELDQTLLDWFSEQRSQGKSFIFLKQWNAYISSFLSDCVAMFRQAMGMTTSNWPVSHVKIIQTIDQNLVSLLSFTEIAISLLIAWLKAKELGSDPDFKASLGWEDHSKHVGSQTLSIDQKTTPSMTTKCPK